MRLQYGCRRRPARYPALTGVVHPVIGERGIVENVKLVGGMGERLEEHVQQQARPGGIGDIGRWSGAIGRTVRYPPAGK